MDNVRKVVRVLEAKLAVLDLTWNTAEGALQQQDAKECRNIANAAEKKLAEIRELVTEVQEGKIIAGEEVGRVEQWGTEIREKIQEFVLKFTVVSDFVQQEDEKAKRDAIRRGLERVEQERANSEHNYEHSLLSAGAGNRRIRAKLPKIEMRKFDGDLLDFMRFWSTFTTEVDLAEELSETSKFSYLKELLTPKVQYLIDGLPFSAEGYEHAKAVLRRKYGQPSEIVSAHVSKITNLQEVRGANPVQVAKFYETLLRHVQALETMDKLGSVNGYTRTILDRLPGIRADLVRDDDNWKNWIFPDLVEALRRWTERNPIDPNKENQPPRDRDRNARNSGRDRDPLLNTGQNPPTNTVDRKAKCVYCSQAHPSQRCTVILAVADRKKLLAEKKRCFNCTGDRHRAAQCPSKKNCPSCGRRHHSSICDKTNTAQPFLLAQEEEVIYPVVVVKINGVTCRALLDTGAGSSYVSQGLIDYLKVDNFTVRSRQIEMMFSTQDRTIQVYSLSVENYQDKTVFKEVSMTKVERSVLLKLKNPRYNELCKRYAHLADLQFIDCDEKDEIPIHVILGVGQFTMAKTATAPRIGNAGEPIAEKTKFGWVMMSPGREDFEETSALLTRNSVIEDFDQLSRLDVLGIEDNPQEDLQSSVLDEFRNQLVQREDGHYETNLLWKPDHPELPSNEAVSTSRLRSFLRRNQSNHDLLLQYDRLIRDQIDEGFVERVLEPEKAQELGRKVCYLPHRPVVRATAESTKMRQVCNASAKANSSSPSLNECLETGPALQNLLWNVIVRTRFRPIVLCGDLRKAFLQIFIREEDRDVLRFHWIKSIEEPHVFELLRFTRPLFGLVQSPFILQATLQVHLEKYPQPEVVEIGNSLYVDDLIKGLITALEGKEFKDLAKRVFSEAGFVLHKWHSNEASLEEHGDAPDESSTFAKETFGHQERQTKLLGLQWNKVEDSLSVVIPKREEVENTKRCILKFLAAIFDPLGFISPVTLVGKCIFRDCCEAKIPWDEPVTGELLNRWITFLTSLPNSVAVPRALTSFREPIDFVDLHVFGDASKLGTGTVAYAVVHQPSGVSQGIIAAKARVSKKATIPRLELIGGVMCANLLQNVRDVLSNLDGGVKIRKEVCWSDSSTAIHWIRGDQSKWKQFVKNHCRKILEKTPANIWRHVPGVENPADIASRGSTVNNLGDNWWQGPNWLRDEERWPADVQTVATAETEEETKMIKEVLSVAVTEVKDPFSELVNKFEYKKVVRISAWVRRFVTNICAKGVGIPQQGPLTTEEIQASTNMLVKKTQASFENDPKFQKHRKQFNLQKDDKGVYVCVGRVKGMYPTYLPTYAKFTELLVRNAHLATLHGGVGLTLTKVREKYWVPRLRQLTKRIRSRCYGCKRHQVTPLNSAKPADLPSERTVGDRPFQVIGLDFAGPIAVKNTNKSVGKAYIIIYTCSLTRALCLELLPDQSHASFIPSLKRMMARRGRPEKIYSDNFSTFLSASKWLKDVLRNESTHDYLASNDIKWQFNLSRAPWWGGQFERMVALVKQSMYKVVGKALLSREELEDVLIDVELCLNNRPLSYVEDDIDFPVLTPNTMMFGQRYNLPEEDADNEPDRDLRKRARYLQRCKEHMWNRWTNEYLRGLRERHDLTHDEQSNVINVGDVMLIKGEQRNRAKWKIGIVSRLISGNDGVVRGAVLKSGRDTLERAVQHLYPMELSCDVSCDLPKVTQSETRVRRQAALKSELRTKEVLAYENSEADVED